MSGKNDIDTMKELWLNEKNSPEILQYDSKLVSSLLQKVQDQVKNILLK